MIQIDTWRCSYSQANIDVEEIREESFAHMQVTSWACEPMQWWVQTSNECEQDQEKEGGTWIKITTTKKIYRQIRDNHYII